MRVEYADQAALVVKVLPFVEKEDAFALKGGTAINLFQLNLPRLSVDIDLTYTKITSRDEAVREINDSLDRIASDLKAHGINCRMSGTPVSRKLLCSDGAASIKVEPNFILRGTTCPTRKLQLCDRAQDMFGFAQINVLSFPELYGGKICAALDRQHPRDLFDIAQFYKEHSLAEVKGGFIALALGHNRPLHELLNPFMQDQREIFAQQFAGMSDTPFTYDEHVATFERLRSEVLDLFTDEDKSHMLNFVSLEDHPSAFGIPHLAELPAIVWKRRNLESLRASNPGKFAEQRAKLAEVFSICTG